MRKKQHSVTLEFLLRIADEIFLLFPKICGLFLINATKQQNKLWMRPCDWLWLSKCLVYKTHTQTHISLIHVVEVITQVIIVIMRSDAMQLRITLFRYNWKILIDTDCKKSWKFWWRCCCWWWWPRCWCCRCWW